MQKEIVLNEIITGYRTEIKERYQYAILKKQYDLPITVSKPIVDDIRNYFLTYVYPNVDRRKELNEAFATLDDFTKNPQKLLNLLLDSFQLIFSHGKHLPKIFSAGLKAMKSFRGATKFENALADIAINEHIKPPYSSEKINGLLKKLQYEEIQEFITNTEVFFSIIHDKVLVQKIQEIISFLIQKMKKKSNLFSKKEIQGLELALETISKGDELLNQLTEENQKILIDFVVTIEKDHLNAIFNS